jgi:ubiquitin carboxyl-terminal hydrolase 9/24
MRKGLMDLELETQMQLFQKEILRLEPSRLSEKGFHCFKSFFESVNLKEHKLKRNNNNLVSCRVLKLRNLPSRNLRMFALL